MLFTSSVIYPNHTRASPGAERVRFQFRPRLQAATLGDRSVWRCMKSNTPTVFEDLHNTAQMFMQRKKTTFILAVVLLPPPPCHGDAVSKYDKRHNISVLSRNLANHNTLDSWPIKERVASQNDELDAFQKGRAERSNNNVRYVENKVVFKP